MAQAVAARGPLTLLLQTSSGQYVALGLGVYALFPDQVKQALAPFLGNSLQFLTQDGQQANQQHYQNGSQQQPIIIQTPPTTIINGGSSSRTKSLTQVLIYSVAGAGACWVGYIVCSQLLPDAVSEFMPVTKRLFKTTSETLGKSITQVKAVLEEQLAQVFQQQEALQDQQEKTHQSVQDVHSELGDARKDLVALQSSLDRCEAGLDETKDMQGYTLRGIKLLVRCVTSFLPDESNFIEDISSFMHEDDRARLTQAPKGQQPQQQQQQPARQQLAPPPQLMAKPSSDSSRQQQEQDYPSLPAITSIDSEESLEDLEESHPGNYMGDIRALLGH